MFYHDLTNFNGHDIIGSMMSQAYHSDNQPDYDYYYRPKSNECLVAVKFDHVVHQTDEAYLLKVSDCTVWFPKSRSEVLYFNILITEKWLADSKALSHYVVKDGNGTMEFDSKPSRIIKYIRQNLLSNIIENLNKK